MSYKSDMEFLKRDQEKPRKLALRLLKITVIALAVVILITAVAAPVIYFLDNRSSGDSDGGEGGGGGSSSGSFRITGKDGESVTVYLGDPISYKSFVTVVGASGEYELSVDRSQVKSDTVGTYKVKYTATDSKNKKATFTLTLIIKDGSEVYTKERLMKLIAGKAEELGITESMTAVQKVQKVYQFVNDPSAANSDSANIYFSNQSNTPSQKSQTGIRTGWETDWVEEACRTLTMSRMAGDCYSYYAVSKAFFEYLGIENYGVQRSAGSVHSGTHFWNIVKVESGWYYYDGTRLAGSFPQGANGCLFTDAQKDEYRTSDNDGNRLGFYTLNKSEYTNFPTIATEPIS